MFGGLWFANHGKPSNHLLFIFIAGAIMMRSAGCVINDFSDRHFDAHVTRTRNRPLATGQISSQEALILAFVLGLMALILVLFCNGLTIFLAFFGALITCIYPLLKRYTHLPQLGLGVAFAFSVPMAFAATIGSVPIKAWFLFLTAIVWPLIYDTLYAMIDRDDDLKIGIKSTAILFGRYDRLIILLLQLLLIGMLIIVGILFQLHVIYYLVLWVVAALFLYQQWLIRHRDPSLCFRAFLNNQWVGMAIFIGIMFS